MSYLVTSTVRKLTIGVGSSNKTQRLGRGFGSSCFSLPFAWVARSRTFGLPVNHHCTAEIPVAFGVALSGRFDERDGVSTHLVIIQESRVVRHRIIEVFELEGRCVLSDVLVWQRCEEDARTDQRILIYYSAYYRERLGPFC
jgi:hypothetical protein